nr:BiP homolog/immunoglobulin-binding protein homolog/heat-shock protein 70 homolog/HDEL protein {N-terminal} [Zea mays=maize, cv. Clipper, coleoptile, Peptide Partial, 19 aa] [Zea mays]
EETRGLGTVEGEDLVTGYA